MWGEGSDEKLREGAQGPSWETWGLVGVKTSPDLSQEVSGQPSPSLAQRLTQQFEEGEWGRGRGWEEADRRVGTVHRVRRAPRSCPAHCNARLGANTANPAPSTELGTVDERLMDELTLRT